MVVRWLIAHIGIMGRGWCNEIGRNELGALVDKLIEGMLAICPSRTPNDRLSKVRYHTEKCKAVTYSCLVIDAMPILCYKFAIRLHISLRSA